MLLLACFRSISAKSPIMIIAAVPMPTKGTHGWASVKRLSTPIAHISLAVTIVVPLSAIRKVYAVVSAIYNPVFIKVVAHIAASILIYIYLVLVCYGDTAVETIGNAIGVDIRGNIQWIFL